MTRVGDYVGEMPAPHEIDDATAEALIAGRAVAVDLEPLATVLVTMRRVADRPVPPSADLAAQLAAGVFTSAGEQYSLAGDRNCDRGGAAVRRWRRPRMSAASVLAVVTAKLSGMSVVAKAGAGLAIALASVSSAGFTGVLPGNAQDRFERVVESVTPYHFEPESGSETSDDDSNPRNDFGERVSEDAKDGGVDGREVSEDARERNEQRRPGTPADPGKPSDVPGPGEPPGGKLTEPGRPPGVNPPTGQEPPTSPPAGPPVNRPAPQPSGR